MIDMNKYAYIAATDFFVPSGSLTNDDLASQFPDWDVDKIFQKTGIATRYIARDGECASDLAVSAAHRLFDRIGLDVSVIDYVIYCTQSPDYFLPATACVIQDRLGLSVDCGAIDVNQGCSGFVYSLGLAKGLIESGQVDNVLILNAETYSKYINPGDKSVRTLFGDAASVTLVSGCLNDRPYLHSFCYGTDGRGAKNLIVPAGASRNPLGPDSKIDRECESGNVRSDANLYMNGPEIFAFTLKSVPQLVDAVLERANIGSDGIDYFVPHQANKFMLDALIKRLGFEEGRIVRAYEDFGNTVSCTIPIALAAALSDGKLESGTKCLLAGFGVGYSWAGCIVEWR